MAQIEPEKAYYIVNPKGTIHEVNASHARERLKTVGWRLATSEEIEAYSQSGGNQRFDRPLAAPFMPLADDSDELAAAEVKAATPVKPGKKKDEAPVKE